MHRDLKTLLHTATGRSRFVVVVFLDVRGFSSFAKMAESSETAEFLKSAYTRMLDEYFADASFFKPTGDGLLVILDYDNASLSTVVQGAVEASVRLVEDFATITGDDPMINFDVPADLGIGLARGAATCLMSDDKVLDYSGRPLNLASRLMDVARPSGVVFDASLGLDLLDAETAAKFSETEIFVKGLAESLPIKAFCLEGRVSVPEFNKRPINSYQTFAERPDRMRFNELKEREIFDFRLTHRPADEAAIVAHVTYPALTKARRKHPKMLRTRTVEARYVSRQNRDLARVDYRELATALAAAGVKDAWDITVVYEYPIRDAAVA